MLRTGKRLSRIGDGGTGLARGFLLALPGLLPLCLQFVPFALQCDQATKNPVSKNKKRISIARSKLTQSAAPVAVAPA